MSVHVYPENDGIEHDIESLDCLCGPMVEFKDPADDQTYANGPLVVHHSLDGREANEGSAPARPGREWTTIEGES